MKCWSVNEGKIKKFIYVFNTILQIKIVAKSETKRQQFDKERQRVETVVYKKISKLLGS